MCTVISTESTGVYTEITSVQGSMCAYISTKGTGVHGGTYTDVSTVKTVVQLIMDAYENYGGYKLKQDIGTDTVGKLWKGISYVDSLQQSS